MSNKDALFASLLSSSSSGNSGRKGPLISEVGKEVETASTIPGGTQPQQSKHRNTNDDEGPSMLELMMAAQQEAAKEQIEIQIVEEKKEVKKFGNGFKKGFFGNTTASSSSSSSLNRNSDAIPTITKKKDDSKASSLILNDVQKALEEDANSNPILNKLKEGDWVTPDLMSVFQKNNTIAAGLKNTKCMTAMQLMQTNPKEAQKRYQNDPEVDSFLREFGRVMSGHFTNLDNQKKQQQQQQQQQQQSKIIEELGPLQAEAVKRASLGASKSVTASTATTASELEEQKRVNKILEDSELRELLMDADMQRILQECGDPIKFQQHMRNPVTSNRIKKLYEAGLVGTAR